MLKYSLHNLAGQTNRRHSEKAMGPLFSLLVIVMVAIPVGAIVLIAARAVMPWRYATLMALAVPSALWIGFLRELLSKAPFYPGTLTSTVMVVSFLGVSAATGLALGVLAGYCVWRLSRR